MHGCGYSTPNLLPSLLQNMYKYLLLCLSLHLIGCLGFRAFSGPYVRMFRGSSYNHPRKLTQPTRLELGRHPFIKRFPISPVVPYMATGDRFYPSDGNTQDNLTEFPLILEAIKEYRKKIGNVDIPLKFDIPDSPDWPKELRNMKLGRRLAQLQQSDLFIDNNSDMVKQLAEAGWDPRTATVVDEWQLLIKGLEGFKQVHGHLRVPTSFAVPCEPPYDPLIWNDRLGKKVAAMRSTGRYVKADPARKAQVDEMGFEWAVRWAGRKADPDEEKFDNVVWALKLYKDYVGNVSTMVQHFVVPSKPPWPEALYGFTVGYYTKLIRHHQQMIKDRPDRVKILEELGFNCGAVDTQEESNDRQYALVLESLKTYKKIYGDLSLPQKFVVPSEEPWPVEAWGLRLGPRVWNIRTQGMYVSDDEAKR